MLRWAQHRYRHKCGARLPCRRRHTSVHPATEQPSIAERPNATRNAERKTHAHKKNLSCSSESSSACAHAAVADVVAAALLMLAAVVVAVVVVGGGDRAHKVNDTALSSRERARVLRGTVDVRARVFDNSCSRADAQTIRNIHQASRARTRTQVSERARWASDGSVRVGWLTLTEKVRSIYRVYAINWTLYLSNWTEKTENTKNHIAEQWVAYCSFESAFTYMCYLLYLYIFEF